MKREKIEVLITTDFIKLDQLLKFSGVIETGGIAKEVIQDGEVSVNGERCLMRGKKMKKGDMASIGDIDIIII